MKSILKLAFAMSVVSIMPGCASIGVGESDFACQGYPQGVRCMSAMDVYELTDDEDYKERISEVAESQGGNPVVGANKVHVGDVHIASKMAGKHQEIKDGYIRSVLPKATRGTIPLRTPAKVLRVYINAWESVDGDLNVPGYIYTEVEKRRWMIGSKNVTSTNSIISLQSVGERGKGKKPNKTNDRKTKN